MVSPEVKLDSTNYLAELDPRINPAIALQTFEYLGVAKNSPATLGDFSRGDVLLPHIRYTGFQIENLGDIYNKQERLGYLWEFISELDGKVAEACASTVAYRYAESMFLHTAMRLNAASETGDTARMEQLARHFKEQNEALYGIPDQNLVDSILGDLWQRLDALRENPDLHESKRALLDFIDMQTTFEAQNGESCDIPALPRPETFDQLPVIDQEVVDANGEVVRMFTTIHHDAVQAVWQDILTRTQKSGQTAEFQHSDIVRVFTLISDGYSAMGLPGYDVVIVEGKSMMSWSSERVAMEIGENRAPIKTPEEMYGHTVHEAGGHAAGYMNGLKLDIPVLATGMFTLADEGENTDYLGWEEGRDKINQRSVAGVGPEWRFKLDLDLYLAAGLAYRGWNFRQVTEQFARVQALLATPAHEPLAAEIAAKTHEEMTTRVNRIYRSTPIHEAIEVDGAALVYAKDICYLPGTIKYLRELKRVYEEGKTEGGYEGGIKALAAFYEYTHSGKFDPTNRRQKETRASANFVVTA